MLTPPIEPMLARPSGFVPPADLTGTVAEPKWDGFRCIVFRDDGGVVLQGRGRSRGTADEVIDLGYAFPEIVAACMAQLPSGTVVDGEIVAIVGGRLDFGLLQSRLRPRSESGGSNIAGLAASLPASLLVFDVLATGEVLMDQPFARRRAALEAMAEGWQAPLILTPQTDDPVTASGWFHAFEAAGVDGLILKGVDDAYAPGVRAQLKIKHRRTADVVVAGWRPHARPGTTGASVVGSLLLGLFDDGDTLQYVGVASAFTATRRSELVDELAPLVTDGPHPWRDAEAGARVPGEINRWNAARRGSEPAWIALRPELVAEVTYDQLEAGRFRHVVGFVRWRPDRGASTCTYDQLERPESEPIEGLLTT